MRPCPYPSVAPRRSHLEFLCDDAGLSECTKTMMGQSLRLLPALASRRRP